MPATNKRNRRIACRVVSAALNTINAPDCTVIDVTHARATHTRVHTHARDGHWTRGASYASPYSSRRRRENAREEEKRQKKSRKKARTRKANGAIPSISRAYEEPVFLYRVSTSSFLARRRNAVTKGEPSLSGCSRRKKFLVPFPFWS